METVFTAMLVVVFYSVQGTVSLDSGAPVDSPFLVQLVKGSNISVDCVFTSPGGDFTFQDVPAGLYYMRIQHQGFEDVLEQVEVPIAGGALAIVVHRRDNGILNEEEATLGDRYHVSVRQLVTPAEAIRHYEKAATDFKDGKTERGIWHLQRAIEIAPDFLEAADQLSDVFYKNGRYSDAEMVLAKMLASIPSEQRLHLVLARVLVREHKYTEALAQVDAYLQDGAQDADRSLVEKFRAKLSRHVSN